MNITIVGGGITGLTLASELMDRGFGVTVLEKEGEIGGLAKSFHYDGWSIDMGPHRFHTEDNVVNQFIRAVLGDDVLEIERLSMVYFQGLHMEWPLTLGEVLKLPLGLLLGSGSDLLFRSAASDDNYESYVLSRYGKTLVKTFFKEYNHKFLKMDLKECHRHWAEAGINRALIDKGVKGASITELLIGLLFKKKNNTKFLYPKSGPVDVFCKMLKERILKKGGKIEVDVIINNAVLENNNIKALESLDGRSWESDFVIWTGVIQDIEILLGFDRSPLEYISTVFCNLLINGQPLVPSQWEYFGSRDIIFCRTSTNTSFNPILAPEGYYGISIEIICYKGDYIWQNANSFINSIIQKLIEVNMVRNYNSIEDIRFERVSHTYPTYRLDYVTQLERYRKKIERIGNLLCCGRTGGFWYNNMDHCIKSSLEIVKKIDNGSYDSTFPVKGLFRGDFFSPHFMASEE